MGYLDTPQFKNGQKQLHGLLGMTNMTKPGEDASAAQGDLNKAATAYDGMAAPNLAQVNPTAVTSHQADSYSAGPSAYSGIAPDAAGHQAQQAQLAALSSLAKNGGRSAASDANLAEIQQNENTNARGQREAVMQNAQARGMGGSGNSLLAQLASSQDATNRQSAQDMSVRGQDQQTAIQAGQAAAGIGSNMENQSFNEAAQKAAAQDAIDKFNAGNKQQVSVFNAGQGNSVDETNAGRNQQAQEFDSNLGQQEFADTMGIRGGQQKGAEDSAEYWANKYKEDQKANGGMLGGAGGFITKLFAARGGRIPGVAPVSGDNRLNDIVPVAAPGGRVINTSPDEVIVPRTLAKNGSKDQIASFVKNPPPIAGSKDKEAMLSALSNLRRRR